MTIQIQDTFTSQMCNLPSSNIKVYLCGVTTYDHAHIGHARTIIVFDILRRYIKDSKINLFLIQNFTDVDDKIITRAKSENITTQQISTRYIKSYFEDSDALNIIRADVYPQATDHIIDIITLVGKLIKKQIAYTTQNGIYFDVSKFQRYGNLSGKKVTELQAGSRIKIDETKLDPLDFALWKFSEEEPAWESPWGKGRPGWHIECSAMCAKYVGDGQSIDIHGGGRDLIFPHHENEIAQSEACQYDKDHRLAHIWMHIGMVTINGEKMSKSLGNVKTIKLVLEEWGANVIRLFCISTHYSKPIDYTVNMMRESFVRWRQIESCYHELAQVSDFITYKTKGVVACAVQAKTAFDLAMDNDMNTHLAVLALLELVKDANNLEAKNSLNTDDAYTILQELQRMINILGLKIQHASSKEVQYILESISNRERHRKNGRFKEADKIRTHLISKNIELVDRHKYTIWIKRDQANQK